MAEFVDVIRQFDRMCKANAGCFNCPLHEPDGVSDRCSIGAFVNGSERIEREVMKWAAEHPVVYPTWAEWLVDGCRCRSRRRRDSMSEKITLTMSREQAQAVMDATELLARLEIGQFEEITWKMLEHFRGKDRNGKPTFDGTSRDLANAYLKCACLAVFGVKNGWPDVGEKNMQHNRCWAVYATIRHELAWHDHPEGGDTVDFGEPLGYGEPLPKCEVKEG